MKPTTRARTTKKAGSTHPLDEADTKKTIISHLKAGTLTLSAPTRINRVDLIDFINLESSNVIALGKMVRAISDVLTDADDDNEGTQDIFPGLAVVGSEIESKVEAIKGKADQLYKAYAGGAR